MIEIITKTFLKEIEDRFEDYFNIYFQYRNYVKTPADVFAIEPYLEQFREENEKLNKDIVIGLFRRNSLQLSSNFPNGRKNEFMFTNTSDRNRYSLTEFKQIQYEIDITFFSNSLANIELIENKNIMKYASGSVMPVEFKIKDIFEDIRSNYMITLVNSGNIESLREENYGSLWALDCTYRIEGVLLSYESNLYPKLYKYIVTGFVDDQKTFEIKKEAVDFTEYGNPIKYVITQKEF